MNANFVSKSLSVATIVALTTASSWVEARGGGGGRAGGGGGTRTSVNAGNRSGNVNRNANANVNRNANVNVNRNVNVNGGYGGYRGGGYYGGGYHPVATAVGVAAAATVTAAAVGAVVNSIPPSCSAVSVSGVTYQQCGSTWYQPRYAGAEVTYVVVNPP